MSYKLAQTAVLRSIKSLCYQYTFGVLASACLKWITSQTLGSYFCMGQRPQDIKMKCNGAAFTQFSLFYYCRYKAL